MESSSVHLEYKDPEERISVSEYKDGVNRIGRLILETDLHNERVSTHPYCHDFKRITKK